MNSLEFSKEISTFCFYSKFFFLYTQLIFNLIFLEQTEKAVELLGKFEAIAGSNLDMNEKYMKVLMNYSRDLESIRKLYQKFKQDPMIPRNLPPVAGKIAWARQLYRKIEGPMKVFKTKPEILKVLIDFDNSRQF